MKVDIEDEEFFCIIFFVLIYSNNTYRGFIYNYNYNNYSRIYRPALFSKYTGKHYINYMLLVVPNTEAAGVQRTLSVEGMRGTGCHV